MNIGFRTKRLQKTCSNLKEGERKLGSECAKKLRLRMADLQAAQCLEDCRNLPGRLHELKGDRAGELAFDLKQPHRLVLVPDHDPVPEKESGGINWTLITDILIHEIEDYHGKKKRK